MTKTETSSPFITPRDMAKIVNAYVGEDTVRWSDEFHCFVTTTGGRYQEGTIEDVAAGVLRDKEKAHDSAR